MSEQQLGYIFAGAAVAIGIYAVGRFLVWLLSLRYPFVARESILADYENPFYTSLKKRFGGQCEVFPKIRLSDLVRPRDEIGHARKKQSYMESRNKTLDFVLCDKRTLKPLVAVKLGGSSLARTFIAKSCKRVGLRYVDVPFKAKSDPRVLDEIEKKLAKAL